MTSQPLCPSEDEVRRKIRPYVVLGLCAYFGVSLLLILMILCGFAGYSINFRVMGVLFGVMVLIRRFGLEFVARRAAVLTGAPTPQTPVIGHIVCVLCVLAFAALFWTA